MNTKSATSIDRTIGQRIRAMRKKNRMSQEQLGKEIGVSFQQIQKYENGANRITAARLVSLARKLGVSNRTQVALAASHLDVEKEVFPGVSQEG